MTTPPDDLVAAFGDGPVGTAYRLARLREAGWEVVKLPEPDYRCDRDAAWVMPNPFDDYEMQVDADKRSGITIADLLAGGVYGPWTPETACWIGAALIAAAHSGMAR